MTNDLTEIEERLSYSRDEWTSLCKDVETYIGTSVQIFSEGNFAGSFQISAKLVRPVPTAIRSKAGMIANEIRSCLDALACRLAERNGKSVSKVYFPISKSKEVFDDDGLRKISKLSAKDQQKIIGLAPYREGNPMLWALHEADRTRKHQRLVTSSTGNTGVDFFSGPSSLSRLFGPHSHGTFFGCNVDGRSVTNLSIGHYEMPVGKVVVVAHGLALSEGVGPTFTVNYDEPSEIAGMPVLEALDRFLIEVGTVVGMFK